MESNALKVFVENERWICDVLDKTLNFFEPEQCSAVLSATQHTLVFCPLDALQQAITLLANELMTTTTYSSFLAVFSGQLGLVTDMMIGFCEQYPRAKDALQDAEKEHQQNFEDLMSAYKVSKYSSDVGWLILV